MRKFEIIKRNFNIFGVRYVFFDILYQFFRTLHGIKTKECDKNQELIKRGVNDYQMFIDKNGKGIHRDLKLHETRELVSYDIAKSLINEGDVVLDASANIGYYVIAESKLVGKKGFVYAVEPVKENFEILEKNIKLNNLRNVKAHNMAFSDKKGKIRINIGSEGNLNTPADMDNPKESVLVKAATLDSFLKRKRKPNFIRMDIEGFEDVVFLGGEKTLGSLEVIFVELHFPLLGRERMTALLKKLEEKGFEIHKAVLEWERWVEEDSFIGKAVNYLYRKRSNPVVFDEMTIDGLIKNKDFMEGHHSLEVFFVKKN